MKQEFYFLLLFVAILFVGCQAPTQPEFKTIKNLKVISLTPTNITLAGDAMFYNPNEFSIKLTDVDIDVTANEIAVGKVKQTLATEVPASSDFKLPLKVSFSPKKIFAKNNIGNMINMFTNKKADIHLEGHATVDVLGKNIDVPVVYDEEIPLKK